MSLPLPIKIVTNSVPASYVPPDDMQGVLEAIPQFTSYFLNDNGPGITINDTGAGVDYNGIWVQMLNKYKLPSRILTLFRNNWWPVYTGKMGEIRAFAGFPNGYFDASGYGLLGSGWEGWALCNGNNGTTVLHNWFVIPGYRYDTSRGYGGWITNVDYDQADRSGGGFQQFSIQLYYLPKITVWINATDFFKWTRSGFGENWSVTAPGGGGGGNQATWPYPLDYWQYMWQTPISRIPPYVALGYVQFVGYR